ncbi:hypothetical protein ZIOFF_044435 [Zingiber officinale]|uniref:F-box domain-containing protein n=1 Tax=Zingiber officinale TaxID=94328 RepID=A0A8J5G148_ZINOF|nr:hypothetical protein ZIOFF_044435 [Zingiber officinale]
MSDSSRGNHYSSVPTAPAMKRSCAGTPVPSVPRQFRRTMSLEAELIPGLPDCLALDCLLRLPFHAILDARTVCKRWKHELDSPAFYRTRKAAGFDHRVVLLLLRGKLLPTANKLHLVLYEPDTGVFTMRQLAPNRPNYKKGCSKAIVIGRELMVFGGWDVLENRRTGEVNVYDIFSGAWRLGAPNPAPHRPFCQYGLSGGKMFMVGGTDAEGKKLRSALAYDLAADAWFEMSDLDQDTAVTSIDGCFCDKFWQSREEYNTAIEWCRKLSSLDDKFGLSIRTTESGKEIVISVPDKNSEGKVTVVEVTLNEQLLGTLRRRLGLLPSEIVLYLNSFFSGSL